ncbi:MAG TPA: hypothetical protein P5555_18350, partial [Candidatus Paceibacterota bacterium]|nr:hypothetical protein [Candidatus Paceibacterota bacterium]
MSGPHRLLAPLTRLVDLLHESMADPIALVVERLACQVRPCALDVSRVGAVEDGQPSLDARGFTRLQVPAKLRQVERAVPIGFAGHRDRETLFAFRHHDRRQIGDPVAADRDRLKCSAVAAISESSQATVRRLALSSASTSNSFTR